LGRRENIGTSEVWREKLRMGEEFENFFNPKLFKLLKYILSMEKVLGFHNKLLCLLLLELLL
jgi:hypothetical protein